jgi:hypothetical protein
MRDVAHQSVGARAWPRPSQPEHVAAFAENIAESRDWSSYWEIDRYNWPAPVDYKNDEFWYNLPANVDSPGRLLPEVPTARAKPIASLVA